ncbi:serine hydrolase [Brevibacterium jeotgali]|uniref:Beta-lactamase class A n=1 Tax=Brevibacterium jeotgali TaxID=1262550 RepID=A0A2H1L745_9MICO|nr:serine hydrolase [Brevibacterium jeotgali]TWB98966.1 beta-lactamase class A [Brevibacterium jeotgali]SMY12203.1 beta-lactamase class A [Brevibacterium jeotgali]
MNTAFEHLTTPAAEVPVAWSIDVVDLATGLPLLRHEPDRVLGTASVGKIFLLLEAAARIADGRLDPAARLPIRPEHEVADSGLLHLFRERTITVADACLLVGAVSDNLATNALTDLCGSDAVRAVSAGLGLQSTAFLDVIRDERTDAHPWAPSCGTAQELSRLFAMLHAGEAVSEDVSARVLKHLAAGVDASMVAGGLHLDPLAHLAADGGVLLRHKTGHDTGVRVDAGVVVGAGGGVAYAAGANWSPAADTGPHGVRVVVETHMRAIGEAIRSHVSTPTT